MKYIYVPPTVISIPEDSQEVIQSYLRDPFFLAGFRFTRTIPLISVHDGLALDSLTLIVYAVSREIPFIQVAMIDEFVEHAAYREQWVRNRRGENEHGNIHASLDSRNPLRYS